MSSSVTAQKPLLTTKPKLLDAGTYYLQVQSTNKKGGDADYTVGVNSSTIFYTKGDTADDVFTDAKDLGTVSAIGNLDSGWVGYGDASDFKAITLDTAAKLNFTVSSDDAVKFTVYQLDAKGKLKSLGSVSAKAGKDGFSKDIFVDAGTYYLQVQSTNAKKGGDADYEVTLNGKSVFFTKGYNGDDTVETAIDLDVLSEPAPLDADWVGLGDEFDYRKFTLESGTKLSFTVNSSDAVKFTVWQETGGKLKSLQNISVKAGAEADTKELLLSAGDYYYSVQSTNASKGGNADYEVTLNEKSVFFPQGDNTNDTWQMASAQEAKLEGEEITGWVGFGDAADFIKFELEESGKLDLNLDPATVSAFTGKQIKITCLDSNGKSVALATKLSGSDLLSKNDVSAGEYYLGVTCANVKKYDTAYSITTGLLAAV